MGPTSYNLQGAYDLHIHASPDVIPRAQTVASLLRDAHEAGMAGIGLKDHTAPTTGAAALARDLDPTGPRCFSYLVLNPTVGGLNPYAVEAALREGVDIVCFPTYAAAHQIARKGSDAFPAAFPRPAGGYRGITILEEDAGKLRPEVLTILDLVAKGDAVLATGHIAPEETLALLRAARERKMPRLLVTHASSVAPGMSPADQRLAVEAGAVIEHCLMPTLHGNVKPADIVAQIRAVGVDHCILTSDLGQAANGPVVAGFARLLQTLLMHGLHENELQTMIVDNPSALMRHSPSAL